LPLLLLLLLPLFVQVSRLSPVSTNRLPLILLTTGCH
jgi:hypothetical protein